MLVEYNSMLSMHASPEKLDFQIFSSLLPATQAGAFTQALEVMERLIILECNVSLSVVRRFD